MEISMDDIPHVVRKILDSHGNRLDELEDATAKLQLDITEIKGILGNLATKDDINGVLRDAIQAAPSWVMILLVALTGVTVASVLLLAHH